jgi:hypothetical protein
VARMASDHPGFDTERTPSCAPGIRGRVRVAPDIPGPLLRRTVEVSGRSVDTDPKEGVKQEGHPPELRPAGSGPTAGGAGPRRCVCRPRPTLRHRIVAGANPLFAAAHGHPGKTDPDLPNSVDPHAVRADGHGPATTDPAALCRLTRVITVPDPAAVWAASAATPRGLTQANRGGKGQPYRTTLIKMRQSNGPTMSVSFQDSPTGADEEHEERWSGPSRHCTRALAAPFRAPGSRALPQVLVNERRIRASWGGGRGAPVTDAVTGR